MIAYHANHVQTGFVIPVFAGSTEAADDFQPRFMELPRAHLYVGFQQGIVALQGFMEETDLENITDPGQCFNEIEGLLNKVFGP